MRYRFRDFVLVQLSLYPVGHYDLADLSRYLLFRREEEAPGHLLGDGRAALDDPAGLYVLVEGARNRDVADPLVLVEAGVFGSQKGVYKVL